MYRSIALRLRVLRAERGWTLNQAAERAGVQPETISDAEHGKRRPYTPTLAKIAAAYGVPVEELLEEPVPLGEAPQGPGRAEWDAAVRSARQLRHYGRDRMEALLSSWRGRRDRSALREMGLLLDEAFDARNALMDNLQVGLATRAPAAGAETGEPILNPGWEKVREADRFYWVLLDMVLEAGLSVRRGLEAEHAGHEIAEAA
jgi:transcriptional regulator with XRE-family HTH domain